MSEGWIQTCQKLLEQIKEFSAKKDKDRLDLVQSMRFSLYALYRSLLGWMNWVNNPDIMATFNLKELQEMDVRIIEFVEGFLKYDVEVTKEGAKKSRAAEEARERPEAGRGPGEIFYV